MADIKLKLSINFLREIKRTAFYDVNNVFAGAASSRGRKFILATPMRIIFVELRSSQRGNSGLIAFVIKLIE